MPDAEKDATVWECGPHANAWGGHDARCRQVPSSERPDPERDAAVERVCMERVGCHDYRHGTDCPMYDWPRSIDTGRPL